MRRQGLPSCSPLWRSALLCPRERAKASEHLRGLWRRTTRRNAPSGVRGCSADVREWGSQGPRRRPLLLCPPRCRPGVFLQEGRPHSLPRPGARFSLRCARKPSGALPSAPRCGSRRQTLRHKRCDKKSRVTAQSHQTCHWRDPVRVVCDCKPTSAASEPCQVFKLCES